MQVFSRVTGQPIQGARVRFALESDLAQWEREHPGTDIHSADPEELLQVCAKPVTTRSGGVALAESAPGRMLVDASFGREYGFAWVDRDKDARARIDVVEDRALSVRVSDEGGIPCPGAIVVVRDSSCTELWRGATDALGQTHWRHASFLIERDAGPGACTVQLEGVDAAPVVHVLRRPFLDPRELPITRTSRASVRVTVTDPAGKVVDVPLAVTLRARAASACSGFVRRSTEHGVVLFESVSPGLELEVDVDGAEHFESAQVTARGPAAAGETRELTIACGRRLPSYRARLVDKQEKPLADLSGTAWLEFLASGQERSLAACKPFVADPDGRIEFVVPHAPSGADVRSLLIVVKNEYGDWCTAVRVPLAAAPGEAETDLGQRVLEEMPTLAAGYVLSDREWPVPGAIVEVSASDDPALDPEEFHADRRFDAVADQLGRFRLRGLVAGRRIALTASAPEHVRPHRAEYALGERKIGLKLTRCASIRGALLLPPGISHERVHVWIDGEDETIPAAIEPNLSWHCSSLAPGRVSLRVTVDGLDETAFAVPVVQLQPGLATLDESTSLDLRTHLVRYVLRVLDANGHPVPAGTVTVSEPREEGARTRSVDIENGVAEILALRPRLDVEIAASGFETLVIRGLDSTRDLRLVPVRKE